MLKNPIIKLTLILFLITAVVAALLGYVNSITADRITAANAEKTRNAMQAVLKVDSYDQLTYTGGDPLVKTVYKAGSEGWVVEVAPSGFGGAIDMVVGIDKTGKVTDFSIISMSETSGLGTNATKQGFRGQFSGKTSVGLKVDGGSIDAMTGATVTSRAVTKGVTAALKAAALYA